MFVKAGIKTDKFVFSREPEMTDRKTVVLLKKFLFSCCLFFCFFFCFRLLVFLKGFAKLHIFFIKAGTAAQYRINNIEVVDADDCKKKYGYYFLHQTKIAKI
jgi:hypothetical protein